MAVESDLEGIDARVAKAASTTADGVSVTRRSVADEIAWDQYKRNVNATASPAALFRGMNSVLVPPGTQ